jgi:hypothetical protein
MVQSHETEHYQNSLARPNTVTARYHAERSGDLPFDAFADQFRATSSTGIPSRGRNCSSGRVHATSRA